MKGNPAISHPVTAKAGLCRANLSPPKRRPDRRNGFTFVGLLVVVAIILILAALSVMGFKRTREKADMVTTFKRIRGFTGANALYATDHNGKYVPVFAFDEDGQGAVQWHYNRAYLEALIGDKEAFENSEVFEGIDGLPEQVLDPIVFLARNEGRTLTPSFPRSIWRQNARPWLKPG
jgi:hypothetical protein